MSAAELDVHVETETRAHRALAGGRAGAGGYAPSEAAELAARIDVDLHLAVELLERGCPRRDGAEDPSLTAMHRESPAPARARAAKRRVPAGGSSPAPARDGLTSTSSPGRAESLPVPLLASIPSPSTAASSTSARCTSTCTG